jgi:hypothetical protein
MSAIALATLVALSAAGSVAAQPATTADGSCNVRLPGTIPQTTDGFHGTGELAFSGPWPDGAVVFKPGGPGFVLSDGSLSMKFGCFRGVPGMLKIHGRRLDVSAPPLRFHIPAGFGKVGFQATAMIFPTPGCWEVSGQIAGARLTFVTRVIKVGNGPRGDR